MESSLGLLGEDGRLPFFDFPFRDDFTRDGFRLVLLMASSSAGPKIKEH
jgi:hypothetical protein